MPEKQTFENSLNKLETIIEHQTLKLKHHSLNLKTTQWAVKRLIDPRNNENKTWQ